MMNQISNPGQHSAQPVVPQQHNIRFAPAQQYHGGGEYDNHQQEQSYQQNVAY
uniref:Uncharacterized protein n=1 Tax=Panagrolaimus sp. ES5 TaxID=591445 RepID=A0AC34FYX4_9BILA